MANPLLTPAEAGEQLGLTPAALAQLRYTGGGPCFIKLTAKAVRYRQSDLDRGERTYQYPRLARTPPGSQDRVTSGAVRCG